MSDKTEKESIEQLIAIHKDRIQKNCDRIVELVQNTEHRAEEIGKLREELRALEEEG